jgi:cytochrome P450
MTTTLPPGPKVPKLVQTLFMARYWDRWLHACHRRYGDVFTVRMEPWGEIVYFADPAAIKEIFTTPPTTAHAGEAHAVLAPVLGERSVLVTDEAEHLRRRKLMLPLFHGDAVREYADLIEALTEDELDRWPVGESFALHPRMRELTFEVILRAVFGITDDARMGEMRALLPGLVEIDDVLLLMWLRPELGRVGPWKRWGELKERADALVIDEIRRRRADPALEQRNDVLSLLLRAGMDDELELRDQLITLLLAGHETTATGLAWAFERLTRTPYAHELAIEAARDGEDGYLDAVAQETLRVRPVIFDVLRKLAEPATIAGHALPARTVIAAGIGLVQRSAACYPEPRAFRPERFLGGDAPPSYAWIPFGGGTRRCLGAAFAQMEMRVVLRTVLRRTRLRAPSMAPERPRARHITLVPARGSEVIVETRSARPQEQDPDRARVLSGIAPAP